MIQNHALIIDIIITSTIRFRLPPGTNRLLLGTNLVVQLNLVIKQQIKQWYNWIWAKLLLCNIVWRIILLNIILSICLILPKSLTCSFYCCHPQVSLDWTTTLMRACVTHLTLKFCVTIMTVLLHTAMLISSICLGTTLRIELNGLKMNQLFRIFRLILGTILILHCMATLSWEEHISVFLYTLRVHQWCGMASYS